MVTFNARWIIIYRKQSRTKKFQSERQIMTIKYMYMLLFQQEGYSIKVQEGVGKDILFLGHNILVPWKWYLL